MTVVTGRFRRLVRAARQKAEIRISATFSVEKMTEANHQVRICQLLDWCLNLFGNMSINFGIFLIDIDMILNESHDTLKK